MSLIIQPAARITNAPSINIKNNFIGNSLPEARLRLHKHGHNSKNTPVRLSSRIIFKYGRTGAILGLSIQLIFISCFYSRVIIRKKNIVFKRNIFLNRISTRKRKNICTLSFFIGNNSLSYLNPMETKMNQKTKFLTSAAIALTAMSISVSANAQATATPAAPAAAAAPVAAAAPAAPAAPMAPAAGKEKCYGVVKSGANDCGSKATGHSCAGQATVSGSADEFILLPEGVCTKLNNGVVKSDAAAAPVAPTAAPAAPAAPTAPAAKPATPAAPAAKKTN
jgi:uncharacterized membrane protein